VWELRNAYKTLVGNLEGKRSLRNSGCRWEYNIRMDLREVGWERWTGCIWLRMQANGNLLQT
jgi:hypothetical protein